MNNQNQPTNLSQSFYPSMPMPCTGSQCELWQKTSTLNQASNNNAAAFNNNATASMTGQKTENMDGGLTALPQLSQLSQAPSPLLTAGGVTSSYFPIAVNDRPAPVSTNDIQYMNGFLRTQIGRRTHVEFLVGTNTMVDRYGILLGVGANYILMNEFETNNILVCDFYNIKFVRFFY